MAASGRRRALAQYKYLGATGGGSLLSDPPAGEDLLPAMLYPPPHPSGHADFGWGVRKTAAIVIPSLSGDWRLRADSGLCISINIILSPGRESFFSDPPARKDLLPVTCHPPPPDSEAAWGRGVAIFRAKRGLYLVINICPVFTGAHSSLNRRPEWIFTFTGQVYLCFPFISLFVYFPVYLSPLPCCGKTGKGEWD